jgi:hypothetical protein
MLGGGDTLKLLFAPRNVTTVIVWRSIYDYTFANGKQVCSVGIWLIWSVSNNNRLASNFKYSITKSVKPFYTRAASATRFTALKPYKQKSPSTIYRSFEFQSFATPMQKSTGSTRLNGISIRDVFPSLSPEFCLRLSMPFFYFLHFTLSSLFNCFHIPVLGSPINERLW